MQDCDILVTELKFQPCYRINLQNNTFGKGMRPLIFGTTKGQIVQWLFKQRWLWHEITHEGYYADKQRNQMISVCLSVCLFLSLSLTRGHTYIIFLTFVQEESVNQQLAVQRLKLVKRVQTSPWTVYILFILMFLEKTWIHGYDQLLVNIRVVEKPVVLKRQSILAVSNMTSQKMFYF